MSLPDFQQMTRREIEDYLIEKSLVDPDFRERLIEQPRATLVELGLPVGEVDIQVVVEKPGSFAIVLPHVLQEPEELSVNELEKVSGGGVERYGLFRGYM